MNFLKNILNIKGDQTKDTRTITQKEELTIALQAGKLREVAIARGGTGYLRQELSNKEKQRRKNRLRQTKQSRKANRKAV
jgi:hypothetical protein